MTVYRQACPSCAAQLELPPDSVGRLAKCPACQATFRIGDSTPVATTDPVAEGPTPATEPLGNSEPTAAAPPQCSESPFSEPLSSQTDPNQLGNRNPYQPSAAHTPLVVGSGKIQVVQRPIEDIVSPTWNIFIARWVPLVLSMLILMAVSMVVIVVPFFGIAVVADGVGEEVAGVLMVCFLPFLLFFSAYATVGWSRMALAVARNEPEPLSRLLPPIRLVFRLILGGIIMLALLGLAIGIVVAFTAGLAMAVANDGLIVGVTFLLLGALSIVIMVGQWLLWPWVFVVSDDKGSAIESIRIAYGISINNKLTSLLIVVFSFVLSTLGSMMCYVGHFVTTPATVLLFAVAYLMLTSQPISNPQ
ncbi:hypothetical protein Q31b_26570 [Novipirellula aureliae]|uniref:Uncharacterized protein n=1 Tax=Novipirellula aureliae TaxID=2527966 RepID=A0A5C6DX35_9BACT|nr:hypothetical protein [Novipirellula aureliae]TWU41218.1 hypothetical protein Q31b_26570 [Novipirellula aureliae]